MNEMLALALKRAGADNLRAFQQSAGLQVTGEMDAATITALEPYLLGYRGVVVQEGDTFYILAQRYETTVEAIEAANPGVDASHLMIGSSLIIPLNFPLVPTNIPMTAELCDYCIRGLAARYPFCRTEVLGYSAYGRPIRSLVLGQGPKKVLYNASHHANEWITTPVLLKFAEELAQAIATNNTLLGIPGPQLAQAATVHLVPMVNPDGVDLVTGALQPGDDGYEAARNLALYFPQIPFPEGWKANLLGVDLNLNYPAGWLEAKKIKYAMGFTRPAPRDYVGKAPLDQRESVIMANYTKAVDPALVLAYHTQGQVIYWQFRDYEVPGAEQLGKWFAEISGYALEDVPYASSFAGYKDWFIQEYRRPGYTIEAGLGENPLPISQFDQIYHENLGILVLGMLPESIL